MAESKTEEDFKGEPLQLIEFIQNKDKPTKEIKLKDETLDILLTRCKKRPISVFCVCGPSRRGKSFLLGYMIRCLQALEKQDVDWMGWSNPNKPLQGFKFRNGTAPETQGIWVWSHPFVVKNHEGKDTCVILVDTQGTQDEFTTTRDMSAIVGLSFLMSSVMVFNFFTDLQEDTLVALNTYVQYGLLASEKTEDTSPPFQKLAFLIRDWNNPGEYSYGSKGGRQFLESKLEVKTDQPEEAKSLRRTIKTCFQNLDCFLMPYIGVKAIQKNFKGSISELDDKFAQRLEEFINSIVNSDDILIKEVLGTPISGRELRKYLQSYVRTFNSAEILSPSNMLETTIKLQKDLLLKNARSMYKKELMKRMEHRKYLSELDLKEAHKLAETLALQFVDQSKQFGDSSVTNASKIELLQIISKVFNKICKRNQEARDKVIAEATSSAISTYQRELTNAFPFASDASFYEEEELCETAIQIKSQIIEKLRNYLLDEKDVAFQRLLVKVSQPLDGIADGIKSKNIANKLQAERQISGLVEKLVLSHRRSLEDYTAGNKFEASEQLERSHRLAKEDSLNVYAESKKPRNSSFQANFHLQLTNRMDENFARIKEKFQESQKETYQKAIELVRQQCNGLNLQLKELFRTANSKLCQEEFQKLKRQLTIGIFTEFPFPKGTHYFMGLVKEIDNSAENAYKTAANEHQILLRSLEDACSETMRECLHLYQEGMAETISNDRFVEDTALLDAHKRLKQMSINMHDKALKHWPIPDRVLHKEKLSTLASKIEEIFMEIRKKNTNALANSKFETVNLVADCLSMYDQSINVGMVGRAKTKEELLHLHKDSKRKVLKTFKERCPLASSDLSNDYFQKLSEKLEDAHAKYVLQLEHQILKSEESKTLAFQHSVSIYQNGIKDVSNDNFWDQDVVEKAHKRLRQKSLDQLTASLKDSESLKLSIADFEAKIEEIYTSTKRDNSIRCDSEKLKATNLINECRVKYEQFMRKATDVAKTIDDLLGVHKRAKEIALTMFEDRCNLKNNEIYKRYLDSLSVDIEEAYEECLELFELKSTEEDSKTKSILVDCRQDYQNEMNNQFDTQLFVKNSDLINMHHKTVSVVLRKLEKTIKGGLTTSQRQDVETEMENQFERFKMKNNMKLNYETGSVPAIGIDLGTTYCCVAVYYQGKVITVPNVDYGNTLTTPSYVAFHNGNKDVVIGEAAKEVAYKNPDNTIYDVKRILGRNMSDPVLQSDIKMWPFTVKEDEGVPKICVNGKLLYPEEVSAKLLSYLKTMAEKYLKLERGTIKKAVITVPAYFNDGQRQATVDAGKLAGLDVLTILNEPTAAAVAYSLERLEATAKKVLVYDLGGGTFDVAILNMKPNEIDVIGVDGDTHLGGEDFDKNLMTYCVEIFKEKQGFDLFEGKDSTSEAVRANAKRRLRRVQTYCENVKKQFSTGRLATLSIDAIANGLDFEVDISREKFEQLNDTEFRKTIEIVDRALSDANIKREEIDDIVMVGGSSRILKIQEKLREYFGGKALNHSIHPDHCVAYGAAVKAAMMNGDQSKGSVDFSKIQDVTPLSLGTSVKGGWMSTIIPKNTKIPCKLQKSYVTTEDDQTEILFTIYQGEDKVARKNEYLGEFDIIGIPSAPKGKHPVITSMEINTMGILRVEAFCKASGSSSSIIVKEDKQRMSKETIERLLEGMN